MKSSTEEEYFYTAKLGKAIGVHGALVVHSLSGEHKHLISLQTVQIQLTTSNDIQQYDVLAWKQVHGKLALCLKGYDSPEKVKKFVNARIMVSRSQAAKLKEGEVYLRDILGTKVYHREKLFGTVGSVYDLGRYDCLEVERSNGALLMVPLQDVFVQSITEDAVVLQDHELFQ